MDFYNIVVREIEKGPQKGGFEIRPDFTVGRSKDLMVRGKSFYAIWDAEQNIWSTDEYDVQRLVDADLDRFAEEGKMKGMAYSVKHLRSFGTNGWSQFRKYMQNISDNSHQLDENLTFANTEVKRSDYVSRRLPYPLEAGDYSAWDELVGTLYSVEERKKIEWAIGAIVSGDSKKIQKFLVLYGPAGTGKSTILNIVQDLFQGYTTTFDAKALGSNNSQFATEAFKNNPLVAIQQDGDLSKIDDNTTLNSITAHDVMRMNEKFKPGYDAKVNALCWMGTNQPVKITDAKSGIIRRLIDVHPTGVIIPAKHYEALMSKIDFEHGAIAQHCLEVYREMGKNYYKGYRPLEMMLQTDVFFNYIEANFDIFKEQDSTTLRQAYLLYKEFCADTGIEKVLPQYKVREELRNYFDEFRDRATVDGVIQRSYYSGFNANKFKAPAQNSATFSLVMDETESIFDVEFAGQPAQLSNAKENPRKYWDDQKRLINDKMQQPKPDQICDTVLRDIDTSELHFVKPPENLIVVDFDLRDESGEKSAERNLEAASLWPATYAEFSKSGGGVHLHYYYTGGDAGELRSDYSDGIEIKTFTGNASLRRRLTKCNNVPVADISSGLPLKEKKVIQEKTIKSEKGLRDLIERNLHKEIHPETKSSVSFIKKILDDAYNEGMSYDLTDLRGKIVIFANNSSNQKMECLKMVQQMKWMGKDGSEAVLNEIPQGDDRPAQTNVQVDRWAIDNNLAEDKIVFYDLEVYPNLFVICWKYEGSDQTQRMINPTAQEVEALLKYKLVGFYNRRYDNHILYGAYMGKSVAELYAQSQKIISGDRSGFFGAAYKLSYADIWDFSSLKQSLKLFMIQLGLPHVEMDLPWDQPVDPKDVPRIVEYCVNDVESTEKVFESRKQDFVARQILADLSGLDVNDTTQNHTAKIIFGNERRPQKHFVYTDLSKEFPGYKFDLGKSEYMGEDPSEGGYVYEKAGMYEDVAVLDIASMHPTTIEVLNLFGDYTPNFSDLKAARIAIKRGQYDEAKKMLGGKLEPYLQDESAAEDLSYALKIVINIVYGLTAAKFENPFKDNKNIDNIVAKRGALFMIELKNECHALGMNVVHIKTDSIKIANATPEDISLIKEFGAKYGYDFEHEATYDKFCLVNKAVYIARYGWAEKTKKIGTWDATGAEFQHPYVYKTLFTHEDVTFDDICETKQVQQGAMYLDFNYDQPMHMAKENRGVEDMQFVGKVGRFVPVREGQGGGILYRVKDGKASAVNGTKGFFWVEASMYGKMKGIGEGERGKDLVDIDYFEGLANDAVETIRKFGDFDSFVA
jgi:energy-coupling factor transporter ATP-binding protein EcfA2